MGSYFSFPAQPSASDDSISKKSDEEKRQKVFFEVLDQFRQQDKIRVAELVQESTQKAVSRSLFSQILLMGLGATAVCGFKTLREYYNNIKAFQTCPEEEVMMRTMLAVDAGYKGGAAALQKALKNGWNPNRKLGLAGILITVPTALIAYVVLNPMGPDQLFSQFDRLKMGPTNPSIPKKETFE
jgi:hypothetical protein